MSNSKPMWKHQEDGVIMALSPGMDDLALFMEQGTGKTRTLIETLRRRFAMAGRVMNTLIICPLIVKKQWKEQWAAYSKVKPVDIVVLDGSEKRRIKQLSDWVMVDGKPTRNKIVIINPATLEMKELMDLIERWGPEILVVDESHEFKNHKSVRAKRLLPIADKAKHRYISTGTPIANSESDIFMQYRILDGGKTFGTNYYVFQRKFFVDENAAWSHKQNHFPKYVCPAEAREQLSAMMYKKAIRVLKKDCLDLPPFVRQELIVDMSPEQKRAYEQMKEDFIAFIRDNQDKPRIVVAQLAITKAMKLQQIVSGFAFDDQGVAVRFKKVPRLEVLEEQLAGLVKNHKVIVWATFVENYKMIAEVCDKLGVKYAKLVGGMSEGQKNENKDAFNTDPEVRVMIANQGAGGTGVDLIPASYAIYYSKDHSILKDEQSEARNYRGGSDIHEKVTRIDLIAEGTLDEQINIALAGKKDLAQIILDKGVI